MKNNLKNLEATDKKSLDQCPGQTSPVSTDNPVKHTPRTNAFDFMMNRRHKSIGRNSPGRELNANEPCDKIVGKDKNTARSRKAFLANWAEAKGASKRKREYDEVGKCIEIKLKKREKNFKRMLNINHNDSDKVISKRKKVPRVMGSDEDDEKT